MSNAWRLSVAVLFAVAACTSADPNPLNTDLRNAITEMLTHIESPAAKQSADMIERSMERQRSDNPAVAEVLLGQYLNTDSYASTNPRYSQAIEAYEKSLRRRPTGDALIGLGRVYYNVTMDYARSRSERNATLDQSDVKRITSGLRAAVTAFDRGLSAKTTLGTVDTSRAAAFKGEVSTVLSSVESGNIRALRLRPTAAVRHLKEGSAFRRLDPERARESYRQALRISPDYPEAYFNLAGTYYDEKRYSEAVKEWVQGISLMETEIVQAGIPVDLVRDDLSRQAFDAGSAFFLIGQAAKAKEYWTKALQVKPDYSQAKRNLELLREKRPDLW